jgi:hypothetical protein
MTATATAIHRTGDIPGTTATTAARAAKAAGLGTLRDDAARCIRLDEVVDGVAQLAGGLITVGGRFLECLRQHQVDRHGNRRSNQRTDGTGVDACCAITRCMFVP